MIIMKERPYQRVYAVYQAKEMGKVTVFNPAYQVHFRKLYASSGPRKDVREVLNFIFELGNTGVKKDMPGLFRSISINDVILLDGEYYRVDPVGWTKLSPEEIKFYKDPYLM